MKHTHSSRDVDSRDLSGDKGLLPVYGLSPRSGRFIYIPATHRAATKDGVPPSAVPNLLEAEMAISPTHYRKEFGILRWCWLPDWESIFMLRNFRLDTLEPTTARVSSKAHISLTSVRRPSRWAHRWTDT